MGSLRKTEWTERKVQDILTKHFLHPSTKKYEIKNLFVYNWESDYLAITNAGIAHEVEIKVSREDFKNDVKHKKEKHLLLEHGNGEGGYYGDMPNYFYYAVPNELVSVDEVPEYAGLIYVLPWGVKVVKSGRMLTDKKFDPEKMKLTDKFYYNMLNWQNLYETVRDSAEELKELKKQIKQCNKDISFYDERLSELQCENDELKLELKKLTDEIKRRDCEDCKGVVPKE